MKHSHRGSEWRRWDLHLHTPGTKLSDGYGLDAKVWEHYIDYLEQSPVQAFGITDYFSADGYFNLVEKYKQRYPESNKVFFPNLEFRLAEAINSESSNPHIHVIFDNDETNCPKGKINKFLSTLKTHGPDRGGASISCADLKTLADFEAASISLEALKEALKSTFGGEVPYLLVFPANNDGMRTVDTQSRRKVAMANQIDKLCHLFFGNEGNRDYFLRDDRYGCEEKSIPKPVISGSDAHSFDDLNRLDGNVVCFPPTWIKADLTFRGLRQICFEPDERVFIGAEPPVEQRKTLQATKFIEELSINQIEKYNESNGKWFKNVRIPISPELTVIIGNKGSGKSALVDIIGLLGNSRQSNHFSFLSDEGKNKKFKQRGYAENFTATLTWHSTLTATKILSENVDNAKPETVRYLPQNYFEQLTNEIEIEAFRKEIEDVVFSHVEETDRMGKSTFPELQEFITQQSKQETSSLETKLRELNLEIINLEEQATPLFLKQIEEKLKLKNAELSTLEKSKPKEETKPDQETTEQKQLSKSIANLTNQQDALKEKGRKIAETISNNKNGLQKLTSLHQSVNLIKAGIQNQKQELMQVCNELGLDIEDIIRVQVNKSTISMQMESLKVKLSSLEEDNERQFNSPSFDFSSLESLPDHRAGYKYLGAQIDELKEKLSTPQRKYQAYLDKISKWADAREGIVGNEIEPELETIKYLEKQLTFIKTELCQKIAHKRKERKEISRQIFTNKLQTLRFYSNLKKNVEEKLQMAHTKEFSVDIDASFVLDGSFVQDFLNYVNKNRKGPFNRTNEPEKVLKGRLSEIDWNNFDSIYDFIEATVTNMENYEEETLLLKEQVTDVKAFYDFLFSLGYFSAKYELRSARKNLNELSPGEKGLLLLIFYLQLSLSR